MAAIGIQAGNGSKGFFHGRTAIVSRAIALTVLFAAGAGVAQAADSNDRVTPPNPAEVAMLRNLLALQHPSLRQGGSSVQAPSVAPAVTTEPGQPSGAAPAKTEGEACVSPATGKDSACGFGAETDTTPAARLNVSFRVSLDRAMAAAGFSDERL